MQDFKKKDFGRINVSNGEGDKNTPGKVDAQTKNQRNNITIMFNKNTLVKAITAATLSAAMLMPLAAFAQTVNSVPSVSSISPSSVPAGSATFSLTVNGSNFVPGSVVQLNGSGRATTYMSANQLTAIVNSSDLASSTTHNVTVFSPGPGGGTSNSLSLNVTPTTTVPIIHSLSPSSMVAGSGAITLTVNGSGFAAGATVHFNGSPRPTSFVSPTQLNATLSAADLAAVGTANITVTNPSGGTSNQATFTIGSVTANNPVPSLIIISPSSARAGDLGFTMTLTGSNFVSGSVVRFNGLARPTAFVSGSQLTATIFASDIAVAGPQAVSVTNPAPGGGMSNSLIFTVNAGTTTGGGTGTPGLPNTGFGPNTQDGVNRLLTDGALAALAVMTVFGSFGLAAFLRRAQ